MPNRRTCSWTNPWWLGPLLALGLLASPALAADLRVSFIDVGQGDGVLVVSPTGTTVLVDAGPRGAEHEILRVLEREGVSALDLAVLTHAHADHIGGMVPVLRRVSAKRLLDSGFEHPGSTYAELLRFAEQEGIGYGLARAGESIDLGGGARLEVLGPSDPLLAGTRSDCNSNSVILKLVYREVSVLLTGDAELPTEARLLGDEAPLASTALKVAHHGSEHSSTPDFLQRAEPSVAIISAGRDNSFGHPDPEVIERLEHEAIPTYVTALHGSMTLSSDGSWWRLATDHWEPAWQRETRAPGKVARRPFASQAKLEDGDPHAVFASKSSRLYHHAWCKHGRKRISPVNLMRFENAEEAQSTGRKVAKDCGPAPEGWGASP